MKGVATLCRWSIATDNQRQFVSQWRKVARELRRVGALGCHLLRTDNGEFVGLVRWPSDYVRTQARNRPDTASLPGVLGFAEAQLSVEDDTASPFPATFGLAL